MTSSLFGVGASINVNVDGTVVMQSFVGTGGQTLFTITNFTYTPGTNSLLVFINGQRQVVGRDFQETSTTSFTLLEGVIVGDNVDIIGFPHLTLTAVSPGSILVGGTGATLQDVINDGDIDVRIFGAVGDKITNDTAAITAAFASLGAKGGTVRLANGMQCLVDDDLIIPPNCTLKGSGWHVGETTAYVNPNFANMPGIFLNSAKSLLARHGSSIIGLMIVRKGMTFPTTGETGFAGTAITYTGHDITVSNCLILGFNTAVISNGWVRGNIDRLLFDCVNGIIIANAVDIARITNCHGWPFSLAIGGGGPITQTHRSGIAYRFVNVGDWNKMTDCFSYGYFRGFNVSSCDHVTLTGCGADNSAVHAGSIGLLVDGTSRDTNLIGCQGAGQEMGIYLAPTAAGVGQHVNLTACQMWGNSVYGLVVNDGDVHVHGGVIRTTDTGLFVGTSGSVWLDGVWMENIVTVPIHMQINNPKVYIGPNCDFGGWPGGVVFPAANRPLPSITSAAILPIPSNGEDFLINGNTNITSIFAPWAGRKANLLFTGTPTMVHSVALVMKNGVNRLMFAGATARFMSDGVNWYEL